jgi:hypothetical protein
MSSLGRGSLSRATSNNVLFTNNGEEGDDSDSHIYFMNGEVRLFCFIRMIMTCCRSTIHLSTI